MRQMISKAAVVAMCVGLIASGASAAKKDDRGAMMAERAVAPFRTALAKVTNLTDEEKTKTEEILNDASAQVQTILDDVKASAKDRKATPGADKPRGDRQEKLKDLAEKTRDKIVAVLSDEQKPEFRKALMEARKEARGAAGGGRRAGAATKPTV